MPKTELHLHIEDTLEPELALRLADHNGVTLPFDGIDDQQRDRDCAQERGERGLSRGHAPGAGTIPLRKRAALA